MARSSRLYTAKPTQRDSDHVALFISRALLPPAWRAVANGTFKAPDNDDNPDVPLHGHPSICARFPEISYGRHACHLSRATRKRKKCVSMQVA